MHTLSFTKYCPFFFHILSNYEERRKERRGWEVTDFKIVFSVFSVTVIPNDDMKTAEDFYGHMVIILMSNWKDFTSVSVKLLRTVRTIFPSLPFLLYYRYSG